MYKNAFSQCTVAEPDIFFYKKKLYNRKTIVRKFRLNKNRGNHFFKQFKNGSKYFTLLKCNFSPQKV